MITDCKALMEKSRQIVVFWLAEPEKIALEWPQGIYGERPAAGSRERTERIGGGHVRAEFRRQSTSQDWP